VMFLGGCDLCEAEAKRDTADSRKRASTVFIWGDFLDAIRAQSTSDLARAHANCLARRNLPLAYQENNPLPLVAAGLNEAGAVLICCRKANSSCLALSY
jgi:hypothetical protein